MVHDLFETDMFTTMAEILAEDPPPVILDVGAHVGSSCDQLLKCFPASRIIAFEPVASSFERLEERYRKNDRVDPCRLAIGNQSDEVEIHVNGFADTSSILAPTGAYQRYHGDKVRERSRELVTIARLDDWAAQWSDGAIEAMKIDVQGLELDVLHGAERLLRTSINAVISEAELTPLYEGAATFSEIDLFLRECGFVLHQICRIASCGVEQRSTCCDALWVKADIHDAFVERTVIGAEAPVGQVS